ncbi:unnamed protein product [marine sediment metagenome]|uniref:Uncharacterized protein n=1 Tax=marine sediment metagenome TaxID=412755 RepID=X1D3I3_9ZZZZ
MTGKICPLMSARIFNDDGGPEMVYCTPQFCQWSRQYEGVWVGCAPSDFRSTP